MAINIDAYGLIEVLKLTPARQNIMLIGKHGIGKSEIVNNFYLSHGMVVESFFLGQMSDPGDLIGLMQKDEITGRSIFLPPYWWPPEQSPIVLFLDELNRARPEILQAVYDLALNRRLAGKTLPAGSRVIAAVNYGDEYQLTDLDPALVSRFNLYEFRPSVEDWLLWANQQGLDKRIVAFIQANPFFLDGAKTTEDPNALSDLTKTPDRRAWVKVAEFIDPLTTITQMHVKIIAGIVGVPSAIALQQHLSTTQQIKPEQVLLHWRKYHTQVNELSLHELIQLNERILMWVQSQATVLTEQQTSTIQKNILAYLKMLRAERHNEAIAHFASLVENPKYDQAIIVCSGLMEILTLLTDYIANING